MSLEEEARAANVAFWEFGPSQQQEEEEVDLAAEEVGADRQMTEAGEEEEYEPTTDGGDHTGGDGVGEDDGSGNPAAKKKKKPRKDRKPTVLANTTSEITLVSESGQPKEPLDVAAGWGGGTQRRRASTRANNDIPPPTSGLANLTSLFAAKGLSQKDMVALSGAHTIGLARCTNFRGHIYNDTDIDAGFARSRQSNCPRTTGSGDNNLAPLDLQTPTVFENAYYKNLVQKRALLHSDQELFNGGAADAQVRSYVSSQEAFFKDFVVGMIKMGDVAPLTGLNGQIRKNCRRIN
ncbi:hypothetical protein ACQ4PT_058438 [Festuca glaucescens]